MNPYSLRNQILSLARLPISPPRLFTRGPDSSTVHDSRNRIIDGSAESLEAALDQALPDPRRSFNCLLKTATPAFFHRAQPVERHH